MVLHTGVVSFRGLRVVPGQSMPSETIASNTLDALDDVPFPDSSRSVMPTPLGVQKPLSRTNADAGSFRALQLGDRGAQTQLSEDAVSISSFAPMRVGADAAAQSRDRTDSVVSIASFAAMHVPLPGSHQHHATAPPTEDGGRSRAQSSVTVSSFAPLHTHVTVAPAGVQHPPVAAEGMCAGRDPRSSSFSVSSFAPLVPVPSAGMRECAIDALFV